MPILTEQIQALLQDSQVTKVLATTDTKGFPHITLDNTISTNDKGQIIYLELIETSQTNTNLVNSIWFKRKVAVQLSNDDKVYLIKGYPVYSIICGPVFEHYYKLSMQRNPEYDLSTVWVIDPEEVIDDSYTARKDKEQREHPLVHHLDRLAK